MKEKLAENRTNSSKRSKAYEMGADDKQAGDKAGQKDKRCG